MPEIDRFTLHGKIWHVEPPIDYAGLQVDHTSVPTYELAIAAARHIRADKTPVQSIAEDKFTSEAHKQLFLSVVFVVWAIVSKKKANAGALRPSNQLLSLVGRRFSKALENIIGAMKVEQATSEPV